MIVCRQNIFLIGGQLEVKTFSFQTFTVVRSGILYKNRQETHWRKKHIDASVKERPQTLLVPSEEICKRVLCNEHI